jgi:hypothetical protein
MEPLGRLLIVVGAVLLLLGLLVVLAGRLPCLGRLPGDIRTERDGFSCMVPVTTSLILSLLLTIVLNVVIRLFRR